LKGAERKRNEKVVWFTIGMVNKKAFFLDEARKWVFPYGSG
jgi:hypothetical protein